MKAAIVNAFEQSPHYEDFPEPTPKNGEVCVLVTAVGLHPIVKAIASGSHYNADDVLPFIPGIDGVGRLEDGTRVYFGAARSPYGTMAEKTVAFEHMCMPLPDSLDDVTAAAIFNPGLSSWLALSWRAQLQAGETVLINGATGVAGRLAIQIAKHLGAGKIIAMGRNNQALKGLDTLGADSLIELDQSGEKVIEAIAHAAGDKGIQVIIDYLWGNPAETIIAAITQEKMLEASTRIRFIQVGDSAGESIKLPASALRSSSLEIYGSGIGSVPIEQIIAAVPSFTEFAASGNLKVTTEQIPLRNIQEAWQRTPPNGCRFVIIPFIS